MDFIDNDLNNIIFLVIITIVNTFLINLFAFVYPNDLRKLLKHLKDTFFEFLNNLSWRLDMSVHKSKNKMENKNMAKSNRPLLVRGLINSNWTNVKHVNTENITNNRNSEWDKRKGEIKRNSQKNKEGAKLTKFIAIDCEMVGIGFLGKEHMLARISVVNQMGDVIMDKYVQPREQVVDYRTHISGIRPKDIENGEQFDVVQREVLTLLKGRILVGHSVANDLKVLYLKHPYKDIRDISKYIPLVKKVSKGSTPSLKSLASAVLGVIIQEGEHCSVEDARATMRIYNKISHDWERYLKHRSS